MTDETVADILGGCTNDHCLTLGDYLFTDDTSLDDLGYEDVFYPLRCHHRNGLTLRVMSPDMAADYRWGAGDFIYQYSILDENPEGKQVDPFPLWTMIQTGLADFKMIAVDDHRQEADANG